MQRDHKIGLALGILLVGAVAAFFFRHEDAPEVLPSLQTGAELDQRISERARTPYLQQTDTKNAANSLHNTDPAERQPGGLVPDPIHLDSDASTALPPAVSRTESSEKDHIVQRGETLSSIAAKYLGSAGRYEELFAANSDRLRDANDLRVGMELRIPPKDVAARLAPRVATVEDRRATRDSATPVSRDAQRSVSAPSPGTATPADEPAKFQPYRRSPLTPQGADPQSSTLDPKDTARRRMSQLPPRGDVSPPR